MKTSELTGPALDWAVAQCEGLTPEIRRHSSHPMLLIFERGGEYGPSYSWAQGGPIIERLDGFHLKSWLESSPQTRCEARINNHKGDWVAFGTTPLIAAMRCFVSSKLGDEVEVPDELA
jgi:hypothetical protein